MQHSASSSFRNTLTGTSEVTHTSSCGVKWLSSQISNYDDRALLNPLHLFNHALRFFAAMVTQLSVLLELLAYALLYLAIIAGDLHLEHRHLKVSDEMQDLSGKLSSLTAFLLAFYVGLAMTRWWRLRTDGIGGIWGANNNIAALLGVVYRAIERASPAAAERALSSIERIRRYSATSLFYFFLKCGQRGFDEDALLRLGLLTQQELLTMRALPGTQSEYMWAVIGTECGDIVHTMSTLSEHGLDARYGAMWSDKLTDLWFKGRSGAGLIAAQLGCPVLYDYASLVPIFVKVTNAATVAMHAVQAAESHDVQLDSAHLLHSLLTIGLELVPLLFYALTLNSLVIFAIDANSPFDDTRTSFPGFRYVNCLLEDFDILFNVNHSKQKASLLARRGSFSGAVKSMPAGTL